MKRESGIVINLEKKNERNVVTESEEKGRHSRETYKEWLKVNTKRKAKKRALQQRKNKEIDFIKLLFKT